jgi:TAG lipase / steryl ester hydrolase / phospholipase A2 / LPA acyltransferase
MEINVVDDDIGPIHRKDIQDQVSSSFHCENETNTNKPEAASMFDICTDINLSSMDSENTLPKESSAKREIETAKIECPDDNSSARKDEVCSGATD